MNTNEIKLFAVIGNPISHSVSPVLHGIFNKLTGNNYHYMAFKVEPDNIGMAVNGVRGLGLGGLNVTVPYKETVIPYLDEISKESEIIGAVNTIVNKSGALFGTNTDYEGFVLAVKEEFGISLANRRILLLGAGGTAKAVALACALENAGALDIYNRTAAKAAQLSQYYNRIIENSEIISHTCINYIHDSEELKNKLETYDLIINTTSAGMTPNEDTMALPDDVHFHGGQYLYDVVYKPRRTKLMNKAEREGGAVANGLSMLFWQGVRSYEIWNCEFGGKMMRDGKLQPDVVKNARKIFYESIE